VQYERASSDDENEKSVVSVDDKRKSIPTPTVVDLDDGGMWK